MAEKLLGTDDFITNRDRKKLSPILMSPHNLQRKLDEDHGPRSPLGNFNVTPIRTRTAFMQRQFVKAQFTLPKEALVESSREVP